MNIKTNTEKGARIALGGMIGSGKSTACEYIANQLKWDLVSELDPENELLNFLLDSFYRKSPYKDEVILQKAFLASHRKKMNGLRHHKPYVLDRDIEEHAIFGLHNLPRNTPDEQRNFSTYLSDLFSDAVSIGKPDIYVLLECNWENTERRIMKRGRECEVNNFEENKAYLKSLHKYYIEKLKAICTLSNISYIVIDSNEDGFYENSIDLIMDNDIINENLKEKILLSMNK